MKYKNILIVVLLIATCCLVGCSRVTKISGNVKYSDGTPINFGNVVFDDGKHSFFCTVKSNGTYITGGVNEVEGIPDGTYKVWLTGTDTITNAVYENHNGEKNLVSFESVERVAEKYRSAEKTDLIFEVKRGGPTTYDVIVEKP
ncbi:MAG: hypothetical protein LBC74_01080 [Planctomycetaceae bacterium]|jgi:hypothetical protein|nr:hypothetical protein [Planctomycetaceae bacterium]